MEPRVVELDQGVMPSPAGSGELLLVDEWSCRLVFVTSAAPTPGVAVATFRDCQQVLFGYPNDEAQPAHPLYGAGPWSYGFCEVLGSDWAARLQAQNRVVFPDFTPSDRRHFLVACHEDLVEVLADDVEVEVSQRRFEDVALEALRQNLRDHRG
jgi:hypothetical protein